MRSVRTTASNAVDATPEPTILNPQRKRWLRQCARNSASPSCAWLSLGVARITYDFLFYTWSKESSIRPYAAGGSSIKVYTGLGPHSFNLDQPLPNFALLRPLNQLEPAISIGRGVKFLMPRRVQFRVDFSAYMIPLPNPLFRPVGLSL